MITYKLRWLSLLGVLGLLGLIMNQPLFFALFGFHAFLPLFWYDERTESIFRSAASVAFVVGVIAFAGTFVYLGLILGLGSRNIIGIDKTVLISTVVVAWGFTYSLLILTFALSYLYFERKGT